MKNHELYRRVTHTEYKGLKKIGDKGPQSWLRKEIAVKDGNDYKNPMDFEVVTDKYIKRASNSNVLPQILGGFALFMAVGSSCIMLFSDSTNGESDVLGLSILGISLSSLALCIIYYYTMPKKEIIYDRLHGTITFPGWMWSKNITMPFDVIKFSYTTGGANLIGAYQLQLIRPDKVGSTLFFAFGGDDCYQDLSLITWYMDKNRPLPPQKAFDPYREKDFLRRKKAAFQKPLYPSRIPTPEATPEQQAEREKAWKG